MNTNHAPARSRIPNDNYPTPADEVRRGLRRLAVEYPRFKPRTVLEPGAGSAVFCRTARQVFSSVRHTIAVDVRRQRMFGATERVLADFPSWESPRQFDLVATNPPYNCAKQFLVRALELLAPGGLCLFLLRLDFLGSESRREQLWGTVNLRAVWVVPWRIKFVRPRSDRYYTAWFLFDPRFKGRPTISWIDDLACAERGRHGRQAREQALMRGGRR